jgi:hypothetical protein
MKRPAGTISTLFRGSKLQQSPRWPSHQGRKESPQQTEIVESGESGPITPAEQERFHENPEEFAGDARFVGKQPWGSGECNEG